MTYISTAGRVKFLRAEEVLTFLKDERLAPSTSYPGLLVMSPAGRWCSAHGRRNPNGEISILLRLLGWPRSARTARTARLEAKPDDVVVVVVP